MPDKIEVWVLLVNKDPTENTRIEDLFKHWNDQPHSIKFNICSSPTLASGCKHANEAGITIEVIISHAHIKLRSGMKVCNEVVGKWEIQVALDVGLYGTFHKMAILGSVEEILKNY